MHRATRIVRKAAVRPDQVVDTLVLDHRARVGHGTAATGEGGLAVRLDVEGALNDGDAVRLEDGRLVAVRAAAEPLLEVRAENSARLLRAAWQIGGRHGAVEATADALYVADDPALAELVRGLGCTAQAVQRPFRPEVAVQACGPDCGHDHAHDHSHGHSHDHAHRPDHAHEHGHQHDHGHARTPAGGHEHGHGHGHRHDH